MIESGDVYKVVVAMVPPYVALGLGYGSVKWWRMFKPDQCDAINHFNCYFIIPFFTFKFTAGVDPYAMNFRFLAGDIVAKAIAGIALALWTNLGRKGNFSWATTSFSLSCFNNTLVVGVPLLQAMYGSAPPAPYQNSGMNKRIGNQRPSIVEGSILITAEAGSGVAMFTTGTSTQGINLSSF